MNRELTDKMIQNRIISINSEITTELANKIVELEDQLKEAQAQLENKENTNDRN